MIDFILAIVDAIKMVFQFLIHFVETIYNFINLLPKIITFAVGAVVYVPSVFGAFILASVSISVILLIVGRN